MQHKIIEMCVVVLMLIACGNRTIETPRELNDWRDSVQITYENNKDIFVELKTCFRFKYIKGIKFEPKEVVIDYKLSDSSEWKVIKFDPNTTDVPAPLSSDALVVQDLHHLKENLGKINSNRIWIIDDYDARKGVPFKKIELPYVNQSGVVFYQLFEKPLDSIEGSHYKTLIRDDMGAVLDRDIIFFEKRK